MIENIHELPEQQPLQPFWIILTSGDRYEVRNPHWVAIAESYLLYCFPHSDRHAFIRLA